ncbi:MAG: hypothetical protein LBK76_03400, partial [Verrucomicrobiales bacterium]|nr:hypothetical protein [Verrucomicrobiales bacterium]
MKNNIVSNWAALLLTVSGMAALPLSTSAQLQPSGQFLVSGSAVIQSSTGYTTLSSVSVDNGHALRVIGASSSYSGTNITLRPGRDWSSGAHVEDGATVVLHDSSVFLPAINSNGLNVTGTGSRLDTYNVYVSASGQPDSVSMAALVKVSNGAQFTMSGGTLTGDSRLSAAIRVENAVAEVDGITIDNSGYDAHAAYVLNGGTLNITNSQINLSGSNARFIAGSGGAINGENLTITTYAEALEAGGANASLVVVSSSIRTTATGTRAAIQAYNGGAVTVRDSDIAASNNLIGFQRDTASVTLENVRATNQGRAIMVDASASGTHTVNLVNTDLAGEVKNSGSGSLIVNLADNALNGDIVGAGSGTTIITGSDGATITGHVTGSDNSTVTIGGNGDIIIGDVTGSGSATIDIGLTGTTSGVTGDITGNGDSSITITGSNGAIITGTISGDGNAVIDIIVSGSTGGLIGDITQSGSSAVTVTLDDGATGQGSFNGGDLNLGPGSEWTITDDSHLN